MSWTCPCTATQPDDAKFCDRCGQPKQPGAMPASNQSSGHLWKLVAIAAVLMVGGIFGTLVAVMSGGLGRGTGAQTSSNQDPRSAFQQSFDASFKASCRQAAMRSGHISEAVAENYCGCALPVFNQTHDMAKVVASCKQYIIR